ncbi:thiamine ABC transporter ATP-binding protein [Pseudaeromonas sharmana]|uniref:Thiamine ABC transporter ATP-binding protein n=1 Tax=Pseudaeromonas sharmana TaxID=328412 RepID=A0ABV8CJA0_9GAMM
MLICDDLTLQRGSETFHFSLTLQPGELLVLVGPSGAGKSTLLDLLAGFATPQQGTLSWQGESLLALSPAQRPFTTLFQSDNLFDHLTVAQNIGLGLSPTLRLSQAQRQQVQEAAARMGLGDRLASLPPQLSGGQQQRVALARCLVRQRPLLLLDEPFSALDPALRQELLREIHRLTRVEGIGVLLISHHPQEARDVADRLALLEQGRIVFCGAPSALDAPEHAALRRYLGHDAD